MFEGGFLGLDNISVYDRSQPLPPGYSLKQADATGWMAMFALNMTLMCLELGGRGLRLRGRRDPVLSCSSSASPSTIAGGSGMGVSLWDDADGFFKDVVVGPDGTAQRIDVFSWVGLIPLFACEIVDQRLLKAAPRFHARDERASLRTVRRHVCERVPDQDQCARRASAGAGGCATSCKRVLQHLLSRERVPVELSACAACRASTPSVRTWATCTASAAR